MKANRIILSVALAAVSVFCASAQTVEADTTVTEFQPHWYVQGAVGGQETLGEGSFGKLASFNAQIGAGYNFNPVFGARLVLNSWTSKGTIDVLNQRSDWKWKYIAPTVDVTMDLVNLLWGYKPERLFNAGVFAGVGANIAYSNDQANTVNAALKTRLFPNDAKAGNPLGLIWDGTKTRFVGQFGIYGDFNVTENLKLGVELQANVLPDSYNSKKAGNADWYFNGLVSVKYAFGKTSKKVTRKVPVRVQYVEKIVEKIVEVPVEVPVEVVKEEANAAAQAPATLTRDVFFKISRTIVTKDEMPKVAEIAKFMKENPDTKVTITGYADKGTGSMAINLRLAAKRAKVVADVLKSKFNIPASRIIVKSMGEDTYQPYGTPEMNRVAICVAE